MSDKHRRDWDDDITRLFRSNENKLDEMPSHQVWMRLERRLDSRRQYKRSNHLSRYTTMVAAVVAALLMITIVSLWQPLGLDEKGDMAQNESVVEKPSIENTPIAAEEKQVISKTATKEKKNVADTEVEKEAILQPTDDRALNYDVPPVVTSNTAGRNYQPTPLDEDAMTIDEEIDDATMEMPTANSFKEKEKYGTLPKTTAKTNSTPSAPMPRPTKETRNFSEKIENIAMTKTESEPEPAVEPPTVLAERKKTNTSYRNTQKKEAVKKTNTAPSKPKSKSKKDKGRKNKKDAAEEAYVDSKVADIQDFHWLVGNWEDQELRGNSYENWALNSGVLQGEGYYISSGDTSFIEKMQIRQINNEIYFYTSVEKPNKGTPYKLVSFNDERAIFENKELSYPNQIILLRNDTNNFQTIFQNDQGTMNATQVETLGRRNRLERERAVRNLSRIKKKDKKKK